MMESLARSHDRMESLKRIDLVKRIPILSLFNLLRGLSFSDLEETVLRLSTEVDTSTIVTDSAITLMHAGKIPLIENCRSIYAFCARQTHGPFKMSRGGVHNSLDRGNALHLLTNKYGSFVAGFLLEHGTALGIGCHDEVLINGPTFAVGDFKGRITNLIKLNKVLTSSSRISIEDELYIFFTSDPAEYDLHIKRNFNNKPSGEDADDADPGDNDPPRLENESRNPFHQPLSTPPFFGVEPAYPDRANITKLESWNNVRKPLNFENRAKPDSEITPAADDDAGETETIGNDSPNNNSVNSIDASELQELDIPDPQHIKEDRSALDLDPFASAFDDPGPNDISANSPKHYEMLNGTVMSTKKVTLPSFKAGAETPISSQFFDMIAKCEGFDMTKANAYFKIGKVV